MMCKCLNVTYYFIGDEHQRCRRPVRRANGMGERAYGTDDGRRGVRAGGRVAAGGPRGHYRVDGIRRTGLDGTAGGRRWWRRVRFGKRRQAVVVSSGLERRALRTSDFQAATGHTGFDGRNPSGRRPSRRSGTGRYAGRRLFQFRRRVPASRVRGKV